MDAVTDEELARQARTRAIQAKSVEAATHLAATEERLAATFALMADQRPVDGERLQGLSEAARSQAVRARRWAAEHS